MIQKRREPLSVPNEVMLHKMTSEIKKKNTVILSGEGADELFFGYDRIFRWAANNKQLDFAEFSRLYSYGSHEDTEIVEDALGPFMHHKHTIDIVAHFFQVAHLQGLLRRLDNATMLCSVEARVPFVDHHPLIERMAGVSFDYRMEDGEVKSPLKRIFRDLVPSAIIERKKVGFPVPLERIPFPNKPGKNPMDRWLEFNLSELCGTNVTLGDLGVPQKGG
jgi:asparagine synthase (glutamine-hydrolysing)